MSGCTSTPARTILSLVLVLGGAHAQASAQQTSTNREHIVRQGETLWGLAGVYYTNHFLWPVIYEANRSAIRDPHWIYPDQRLLIPGVEGGLPVAVQQAAPAMAIAPAARAGAPGRTRFYMAPPPPNQEREAALVNRREPLYAVSAAEYLSTAWLADTATLGVRARLAGLADPTRQADRLPARLLPHDRVLASRLRGTPARAGDSLLVVRIAERVGRLGHMIRPVAIVRVDSVGASAMRLVVVNQFADAMIGDHLIAMEPTPALPRGQAQPVGGGAEGRLIRFLDEEPLYGTQDHGFVDLGRASGLALGDELIAFVEARRADRRTELPPEVLAMLRVVRVGESSATVRVAETYSTGLRPGLAVRVVRRVQ